jgi:chemotaxis signal transduction protein
MSTTADVVMFEVGDGAFAIDLTQVQQIDGHAAEVLPSMLGACRTGKRSLLLHAPAHGVRRLQVDRINGVRRVNAENLRRLPPAVGPHGFLVGVFLEGPLLVMLLDAQGLIESAQSS